jgi:hypothetical protein
VRYILVVFVSSLAAQSLNISPQAPSVSQGKTITFTSTQPVTWSLAGAGSLVAVGNTTVTYLAPTSVIPQGVAAGCQTTPSDSVFNTRIDNLPLEAHSAQWTGAMTNPTPLSIQPDWGVNIVDGSTPMQQESFLYTPQNNGSYPRTDLATRKEEAGSFQTDLVAGSSDKQAIYVDPRSCTFYETYKQYMSPRVSGAKTLTATSGVTYTSSSYALPSGGTSASNLYFFPTMLRASELYQGYIPHAFKFTYSLAGIRGGTPYWPANSILGCAAAACPNSPPYGARFRLKASYDISHFSANAQVILRALQQYGMFLGDVGTGGAVLYADTDTTEDPAIIAAFGEIYNAKLLMSSFEAVDESSFIVSTKSMQVNPANPYQAPANSAVLTATPSTGPSISLPIALQAPVAATVPTLFVVAGTPSYTLPNFGGGQLAWKLVSGAGGITGGGVFYPPAASTTISSAVLQATPCGSNTPFFVHVTILPASPDGAIRIDAGSNTGTKSPGKTWLPDVGYEGAQDVLRTTDYPKWQNQTDPDINVYQSFHYLHGGDLTYSLGIPNGNYNVRMMFGVPYNGVKCTAPCTYNPNAAISPWGPYNLVVNGTVVAPNYDPGAATNHTYGTPTDIWFLTSVTNNQIVLSIRGNRSDSAPGLPIILPMLSGIEIVPVANQ